MLQIIGTDGRINKQISEEPADHELIRLHKTMILTRVFDTKMLSLQRQGRIGFCLTATGEEATHIGSAFALRSEDWIFPAYREPGVFLLRGMTVRQMVAQMFGTQADLSKGRQMSSHFTYQPGHISAVSSPIATQIPHAVGAALAARIRGDPVVTMVYFGDGATSEGDFHTGMNFAGVFKTPTVFVCKNNQWAISTPVHQQTAATSIAVKAEAYGFEGLQVDGNDIFAVYEVSRYAVQKARQGNGPTLIEALTYRMGAHSTADDPTKYRSQQQLEEWRQKDPIHRFKLYLQGRGLWSEAEDQAAWQEAEQEVNDATKEAERTSPPSLPSLFEDVYAALPWNLKEQLETTLHEHSPST